MDDLFRLFPDLPSSRAKHSIGERVRAVRQRAELVRRRMQIVVADRQRSVGLHREALLGRADLIRRPIMRPVFGRPR